MTKFLSPFIRVCYCCHQMKRGVGHQPITEPTHRQTTTSTNNFSPNGSSESPIICMQVFSREHIREAGANSQAPGEYPNLTQKDSSPDQKIYCSSSEVTVQTTALLYHLGSAGISSNTFRITEGRTSCFSPHYFFPNLYYKDVLLQSIYLHYVIAGIGHKAKCNI